MSAKGEYFEDNHWTITKNVIFGYFCYNNFIIIYWMPILLKFRELDIIIFVTAIDQSWFITNLHMYLKKKTPQKTKTNQWWNVFSDFLFHKLSTVFSLLFSIISWNYVKMTTWWPVNANYVYKFIFLLM